MFAGHVRGVSVTFIDSGAPYIRRVQTGSFDLLASIDHWETCWNFVTSPLPRFGFFCCGYVAVKDSVISGYTVVANCPTLVIFYGGCCENSSEKNGV